MWNESGKIYEVSLILTCGMTTARLRIARDKPENFEQRQEVMQFISLRWPSWIHKSQFGKLSCLNISVMIVIPWPAPAALENKDARV